MSTEKEQKTRVNAKGQIEMSIEVLELQKKNWMMLRRFGVKKWRQ